MMHADLEHHDTHAETGYFLYVGTFDLQHPLKMSSV